MTIDKDGWYSLKLSLKSSRSLKEPIEVRSG